MKVPCINARMHVHVPEMHSSEARVGSSGAQMLTEHIMRFKRPVFDPRDKKRFFWNRNWHVKLTSLAFMTWIS